jgi:Mrp family chromosome partitioning ATPase/DUF971 family protein
LNTTQENPMVSEREVLDSMRGIIDPDLGRDIVSLGFIKNLDISGDTVSFDLQLTTPACPVKEMFVAKCREAVGALPGVKDVNVRLSAMQAKKQPKLEINTLAAVDAVIAVSSAKGGVGKSTIAAHLARAIQRQGYAVGLLDTDIYGPSVPTLFNVHSPDVYVRDSMLLPVDLDGLKVMSLGFVLGEAPAVMRGPMVSAYTTQILKQCDWGKLDYLIIDMPPGTGDIQLTLVQQAALDGAIIVTTPQALSLVDVAKGILMFEKVNVPVLGLVENMSVFTCDQCGKEHHIFGSGAETLRERFGLTTLATLPILPGLSDLEHRDAGATIPQFAELADNLHRAIGMRRAQKDEHPKVDVVPEGLQVTWQDGTSSLFESHDLRLACRCAVCVEEFTGRQLLKPEHVPGDIEIKDASPLGNYAVSIVWSDGHSTGIYSWEYLRQLTMNH